MKQRIGVYLGANVVGLLIQQASSLIFLALYYRILGPDDFGLVSFCLLVLFVGATLADVGVGRTVVRELAYAQQRGDPSRSRNALLTLQIAHGGLALLIGGLVALSAEWLALSWLSAPKGGHDPVPAVRMLGALIAIQLPIAIASSALNGMQAHVVRNAILVAFALSRGFVTIGLMRLFGPTPELFIVSQLIVSACELIVTSVYAWRMMPAGPLPYFDRGLLKSVWQFAVNDGAGVILGVGIMNVDRIVLSKLLPLETFGTYSLIVTVASVLFRLSSPLLSVYFPIFVSTIASSDKEGLREAFDKASSLLAVVLFPSAAVLTIFAPEVLLVVTGVERRTADVLSLVLMLRTIGTLINGCLHLPHAVQLASGKSGFSAILNMASLVIFTAPLVLLASPGVKVPALMWVVINALSFGPMVWYSFKVSGLSNLMRWLVGKIVYPAAAAFLSCMILKEALRFEQAWWSSLTAISVAGLSAMIAVAATLPLFRDIVGERLRSRW